MPWHGSCMQWIRIILTFATERSCYRSGMLQRFTF
jgi:hypothetical protein